jgi:hypothetical protein
VPWLMIYTDDTIDNPAKLAAQAADLPAGAYELVADSWVAEIEHETQTADPDGRKKAKQRARQARYRARKRDGDASHRDAKGDARDASQGDAGDAKIVKFQRGGNTHPALEGQGVCVTTPRSDAKRDAGDASRVTRNGDADTTDRTADYRADREPLTDEERARARAGLDSARAALRARRSGS